MSRRRLAESGDTRARAQPTTQFFAEPEPAYMLQGSALTINFTANICDDYTVMWGQMTATGFSGRYQFTGLMNVEEIGAAYGARVVHSWPLNKVRADREHETR